MLTIIVNKLLLPRATMHAKLHMPLLTMSNFTQQIITSLKFIFQFLNSFGPIHAREIETEMIVQLVEFLCILLPATLQKL